MCLVLVYSCVYISVSSEIIYYICILINNISLYNSLLVNYSILVFIQCRWLWATVFGHFDLSLRITEPIKTEIFGNFVVASWRCSWTNWCRCRSHTGAA